MDQVIQTIGPFIGTAFMFLVFGAMAFLPLFIKDYDVRAAHG